MKVLKLLPYVLVIVFGTTFSSCRKNSSHPVPDTPFNITIYINLPSYSNLESIGGWAYVNGGSKGIVVYRSSYDQFIAFDRHSPAEEGTCAQALTVNADNFLQLDDLCSGAKFSLLDGSSISGSKYGLRRYDVIWDGSYELVIRN